MTYIFIENGKVNGYGARCISEGIINIEATNDMIANLQEYGNNYYIYSDGEIVINPNYEQEKEQAEQERINNLTMTALDFVTLLKTNGVTALQIKEYLDSNIELDQQLKYCQNVYCGVVRQLLPITIGNITLTDELVVNAFKLKNQEG